MSILQPISVVTVTAPPIQVAPEEDRWFAVQTRARHEKKVDRQLQTDGIATYLPLSAEIHRWTDRRKLVHMPLFPCYLFVRLNCLHRAYYTVVRTPGVVRFVGTRTSPLPVPDKQIEDIRHILAHSVSCEVSRFLEIGQRVRVVGGCLHGIEGVLVARNQDRTLVIWVAPIQRSLIIRIGDYRVEKV
ncbi:MAG: UpxY family transcription antiterminator [Acidobacteria bacterium]|nr:UpxY family transcription antiterminator [Acidobacteriota bacterium]